MTVFCEYRSLLLKARVDWLTHDGYIWDVKTTSKPVDDDSLAKTIFHYGYHFSAAHHTRVLREAGIDVKGFGWIFVSTDTPYPHIVMKKSSAALTKAGEMDFEYAVELLGSCTQDNDWPGYPQEPTEIGLPSYGERYYDEND